MTTEEPNPIDVIVGANLRRLREQAGMSQGELGEAIGVTCQQVQKYENGRNRISASRLWLCSRKLNARVKEFFVGCEDHVALDERISER